MTDSVGLEPVKNEKDEIAILNIGVHTKAHLCV